MTATPRRAAAPAPPMAPASAEHKRQDTRPLRAGSGSIPAELGAGMRSTQPLQAALRRTRQPDQPAPEPPDRNDPRTRKLQAALRLARRPDQPAPEPPDRNDPRTRTLQAALRLARLHAVSRRIPAALAAIAACAVGLRIALLGNWDTYGALQLPLVFETAAASVIAVATASPIGEPERVAGRWLPFLRLATALVLTAAATAALTGAGTGAHLAGGTLDVLRNVAGVTGLGLLCATAVGGGLAWTGPTGYLLAGVYGLYTQWHHPALTTPWLWPARPQHDLGAAICAGLVFVLGLTTVTIRGARDPAGPSD